MSEQGQLRVRVKWHTMHTQSQEPYINEIDIFFVKSISSVEINAKVKENFGCFVGSWEVIP